LARRDRQTVRILRVLMTPAGRARVPLSPVRCADVSGDGGARLDGEAGRPQTILSAVPPTGLAKLR
jgi:hypothetical protein